ncbi:MAG: galactose mutarotase [Lentisphaeria bacterium]|nr:galactose mutarotase [Lentisphaeria bacterium]
MTREPFFRLPNGEIASIFRLREADGFGVDITDFGGCVTALYAPDRYGTPRDVALGWKHPETYRENPGYLGALIGRMANRIGGGRFTLDGRIYQTCLNDRNHSTLHGGFGYSHRMWTAEEAASDRLTLTLTSPDGDAGFPGKLFIRAAYSLKPKHTLELEITAEADRPTVADFTSHIYFNLEGESSGHCDTHFITLKSDRVTAVNDFLVPTGEVLPVDGTRFDLRRGRSFAAILTDRPGGFDDNFVLGDQDRRFQEDCAVVTAAGSGIRMRLHTSRPGLQFYMGGGLPDTAFAGKSGRPYAAFGGFCLEPQCWPDAVNHPNFPSVRVAPDRPFHGITRWQFDYLK